MSLQKCHGRPQSQCDTDCLWYNPAWRSGPGYCVRDEDSTTGTIQTLCANLSELDPTIVKALMEDLAAYGVFTSNQIRRFDKMSAVEKCSLLSRGLLSHMFLRQFGRNRDEIADRITELRDSWKQWVLGGRLVAEVKTIDQYKRDIDELLARTRTELGLASDVDALPGAVSLVKELTHPSKASIGKGWWVGGAGAALGTAAFLYYVFGTAQGGQMLDTMKAAVTNQAPVTAEPSSDTKVTVESNATVEKESVAPPAANSVPKNTKNAVNVTSDTSGIEPPADGKGTTNKIEVPEAPTVPSPTLKSESSGDASVAASWFGQISADPTYLLFALVKVMGYTLLLALLAMAHTYLEFIFPVWLRQVRPAGVKEYYSELVKAKLEKAKDRTVALLRLAKKNLPNAAYRPIEMAVVGFNRWIFGNFRQKLENLVSGHGEIGVSERQEIEKAIDEVKNFMDDFQNLYPSVAIVSDLRADQAMDDLPDQVTEQGWLRGTWEWAKGIVSSISGKVRQNKMVIAYLTLLIFSVGAAYLYAQSSGGNGTEQGFVNSTAEQLSQEQQPPNALKT